MDTTNLLIEIGCEDLPARFVRPLAQALTSGVCGGLDSRAIEHGAARQFATPRRIGVLVENVSTSQPTQHLERRGPAVKAAFKDGEPTKAALGFAQSCGVDIAQLDRVQTDKGEWLIYRGEKPGEPTLDLLPAIFAEAVKAMDELVPKRMRWGTHDFTFVRPVRWLLALLGDAIAPIQAFGHDAGRITYGHRFHSPDPIRIESPADYAACLREAEVWADFDQRQAEIRQQVEALAGQLGGTPRIDAGLLEEVTALVEKPHAIAGRFDPAFLALPPEVVVVTIEDHQRYFPVFDADGGLLPAFVTVANIASQQEDLVVAGNERVVAPRLADAKFFWDRDCRQPLEAFLPGLDKVTFQHELGSVGDKSRRIAGLAAELARQCGLDQAQAQQAQRAGRLSKADLVTQMVFELPELQGVMGGHYARVAGETEAICAAIGEHYAPARSGEPVPATAIGQLVALADKLDTLTGIFSIGRKPTASKDPFGLRRTAIGILRILGEARLELPLADLIAQAVAAQPSQAGSADPELCTQILEFAWDRLEALKVEAGNPVEHIRAVRAVKPATVADAEARLQALDQFLAMSEAEIVIAAHKRTRNILRQADWPEASDVDQARLVEPAESELFELMVTLEQQQQADDYAASLSKLAALKAGLGNFFNDVMVMAEEPALRANRLALLTRLDRMCRTVADLSLLGA